MCTRPRMQHAPSPTELQNIDAVTGNSSSAFVTFQGCYRWPGVEAVHTGRSTQDRMTHMRKRERLGRKE